jgi:ubiquinone biosynthesis protein
MTFPTLLSYIVGSVVNVALIAYGSRRLLGVRHFPFTRTIVAGLLGELGGNRIINALASGIHEQRLDIGPILAFLGLGAASSLLLSMAILVTWQALIPVGTVPPPSSWPRRLRARVRRTRRYWQIVRIFTRAGLGALVRSGVSLSPSTARSLSAALDSSGVVFIKFGQALSTRRDLLPPEFTAELGRLQDRVTPLPWPEVEQVLREERLTEEFAEIDPEPLAAASIAQVHAARLRTGADVVVKVRRPDVVDLVERDLDIIGRLARRLEFRAAWARTLGVVKLADGFAEALREELDFRVELRNLEAVIEGAGVVDSGGGAADGGGGAVDSGGGAVVIPHAYEDLSSKRVLVMQRLDGLPITAALAWHGAAPDGATPDGATPDGATPDGVTSAGATSAGAIPDGAELARDLLGTMLRQIVVDGIFHADPHPGNILLLRDGRLALIDFGSVGRLDSELRAALQRLLLALDRRDPVAVTDALLEVTARPDELDEQALERAVGSLLVRLRGAEAAMGMFAELFRIVARHELSVPPEFAAVFRALSTLEGGLTMLAPGFDIVAEAEQFGRTQLRGLVPTTPASLKDAIADEAMTLLPMLRRLPRRVDRITAAIEGGRLSLNIRLLADERDRATLGGWLQQVVITVLAATAGLMAVILLAIKGGPVLTQTVSLYQFLGYCLLVICSLLALRVLASIFRAGTRQLPGPRTARRRPRTPHRRSRGYPRARRSRMPRTNAACPAC